ncbi:hypothetical protein [Synechococcus sp. EJ6-Ellesmere]|uniref:hypothetical protein n=1 Tax=Synechococcus sp. EJ6-Ellesmere TaxID=2823734 RepID=UPI0020CFD31A|nr:hypothetical protein [Synechococcus sp. EJ6-Ellesmere]
MSADFSRPGLVSKQLGDELIQQADAFNALKESELPAIDALYDSATIEKENKEWWPTHCEALRRARADLLRGEYRDDLVYFCQDGPFYGLTQQAERERHWWALIAQPNVTMCWPIVMFWGEFVHFEWHCLDDRSGETLAKGTVCWVRRGHRGGCYFKSEQLTFYRDVYASQDLLSLLIAD